MQDQLPDPDVMLPTCYPDTYNFKTSSAARSSTTPTTTSQQPQDEEDSVNSLDNFKRDADLEWRKQQLPRLEYTINRHKTLELNPESNDVIKRINNSNHTKSKEAGKPTSQLNADQLRRINSQADQTFQTSSEAAKPARDVTGLLLFALMTNALFALLISC